MRPTKQSGSSLFEITVVIVLTCLLGTIMVMGQNYTISSKVNRLKQDFNSLQTALYETQISSVTKRSNLLKTSSSALKTVNTNDSGNQPANILKNWKSVSGETFNLWQNTRPANPAEGLENANTYVPFALSGTSSKKTKVTNAPIAGLKSNFIICTSNLKGRLVKQLDLVMDNGDTASGPMMASSAFGGMGIDTYSITNDFTYMVCLSA